jgi:hypothetical protein
MKSEVTIGIQRNPTPKKKKLAVPAKWKIANIKPYWHNDYLPGELIYLPAWQIYLPAQLNIGQHG